MGRIGSWFVADFAYCFPDFAWLPFRSCRENSALGLALVLQSIISVSALQAELVSEPGAGPCLVVNPACTPPRPS